MSVFSQIMMKNKGKYESWTQPILTSNSTTTPEGVITITTSSEYSDSYAGWHAMDGSHGETSAWATNTTTGWWKIVFPYTLKITNINILGRATNSINIYNRENGILIGSLGQHTQAEDIPINNINTNSLYITVQGGQTVGITELTITAKKYIGEDQYQYIDYIETTGTQYFATGLYGSSTPLNNYSVEVDCVFYNANENAIVINNWATHSYFLMAYQNICRWHGTPPSSVDFGSLQLNTKYKIKIDIQNNLLYLDNTSYSYTPGSCGSGEILLLGTTSPNFTTKGFNGKTYSIKFYSPNGDLVREYVPVYNTILQQYGLIDKVTNVFYINNGTGTITGGND